MSMITDQFILGDCLDKINTLPDKSINLVLTSPPYAMQRNNLYGGIPEVDYPKWMVSVFDVLRPKLVDDSSILIVIRTHIHKGVVSDYVLRTRLALREAGWNECEELIWLKPDGPPLGSQKRPRRVWENILWFSPTIRPYIDLKAKGRYSDRIGFPASDRFGDEVVKEINNNSVVGVSRVTDVFEATIGSMDRNVLHPAMYPPSLCKDLIVTFTKEDDVVLDPFAGSGTTLLVARQLRRHYVGIECDETYFKLTQERLNTDVRYSASRANLEWS